MIRAELLRGVLPYLSSVEEGGVCVLERRVLSIQGGWHFGEPQDCSEWRCVDLGVAVSIQAGYEVQPFGISAIG